MIWRQSALPYPAAIASRLAAPPTVLVAGSCLPA